MSDNIAHARKKIDGQRRAVREHAEKYGRYPDAQDKAYALRTIRNAQDHLARTVRQHPTIAASWEDAWRP